MKEDVDQIQEAPNGGKRDFDAYLVNHIHPSAVPIGNVL